MTRLRDQFQWQRRAHSPTLIQYSVAFSPSLDTLEQLSQEEGILLPTHLQQAVTKRRSEYLLGRLCAKRALEDLHILPPPLIASGEDRAPRWPPSVIGSLTHTDQLASALVGKRQSYDMIGLDIEKLIAEPSSKMAKYICRDEEEWDEIAQGLSLSPAQALTLIFSAKEAFYKALYPKVQKYFGFHSARLRILNHSELSIHLSESLNEEFQAQQSWPVHWQFFPAHFCETFLFTEKKLT